VGYSPERINPRDREHRFARSKRWSPVRTAKRSIRSPPVYGSSSKPASTRVLHQGGGAAKVIENSQRDINIAFMNELALIFERMGIDTNEVLDAAGTKWNFLRFRPGLVGGHCIGVDPYYLTHKAEDWVYPAGDPLRPPINDGMGRGSPSARSRRWCGRAQRA